MKYKIVEGTYRDVKCTPEQTVWKHNTDIQIEWDLRMDTLTRNKHDVPYYILGSIRRAIIPELSYCLSICCKHPKVEKYIERLYFKSVEEAIEYGELYINYALEIIK